MVRIPNWNDIACLIDRMSIEASKEATFQDRLELLIQSHPGDHVEEKNDLKDKVDLQKEMREMLTCEFTAMMGLVLEEKRYDYLQENRTFS